MTTYRNLTLLPVKLRLQSGGLLVLSPDAASPPAPLSCWLADPITDGPDAASALVRLAETRLGPLPDPAPGVLLIVPRDVARWASFLGRSDLRAVPPGCLCGQVVPYLQEFVEADADAVAGDLVAGDVVSAPGKAWNFRDRTGEAMAQALAESSASGRREDS